MISMQNGDIKYWSYGSDTENLLTEIFNAEYAFVYWYDNKSRWEELSNYNYWWTIVNKVDRRREKNQKSSSN